MDVTTPTFQFVDGNVSWHLVREPPQKVDLIHPAKDGINLIYQSAETSALLYEDYTSSGATGYYNIDLTAYTAPVGLMRTWQPLGGLGNVHDLRAPWLTDRAWDSLDVHIQGECRVSLYASVRQTDPSARPATGPTSTPLPVEEAFIQAYPSVVYWRVAGALIFEDES